MLRSAVSTLAKRAALQAGSTSGRNSKSVPPAAFRISPQFFHSTSRNEQSAKEEEPAEVEETSKGISPLFAIPIGATAAMPILSYEWFLLGEETLIGCSFLAFCVIFYTQGGDMIKKLVEDEAAAILKIQNDAEDAAIKELEAQLELIDLASNVEEDGKEILALTKASYEKLNAAGKIKPQHDLKAQVEKMLGMIANEEQNVYDKAKISMMEEATASVTESFMTTDKLKKAALDASLAKLTGKAKGGDPVQQAYMDFFAAKKAEAAKVDEAAEAAEARAALLSKMNGIAEAEGMMFRFDSSGKPALV